MEVDKHLERFFDGEEYDEFAGSGNMTIKQFNLFKNQANNWCLKSFFPTIFLPKSPENVHNKLYLVGIFYACVDTSKSSMILCTIKTHS